MNYAEDRERGVATRCRVLRVGREGLARRPAYSKEIDMDIENGEVLPVEDKKVKKEEPTVPAEESGDRKHPNPIYSLQDAGSATEGVPEVKVKMEPEENVKGEPIEEKIEGTKVPEQGVGDAKIRFPSPVFSSRPAKTSLMLSELSYRT
eukprot:723157-Amorphochlora_amoeboformis.AAC.1